MRRLLDLFFAVEPTLKVFKACDSDGNKKITYQEFADWAKHNPSDLQV